MTLSLASHLKLNIIETNTSEKLPYPFKWNGMSHSSSGPLPKEFLSFPF